MTPYHCSHCGSPSWVDPWDQGKSGPPPDYCHEEDHGTDEDRAAWGDSEGGDQ
jgi:hypothetical protein